MPFPICFTTPADKPLVINHEPMKIEEVIGYITVAPALGMGNIPIETEKKLLKKYGVIFHGSKNNKVPVKYLKMAKTQLSYIKFF